MSVRVITSYYNKHLCYAAITTWMIRGFFGTGLGEGERERESVSEWVRVESQIVCRGTEWVISDSWKINRAENCECHLKNYIFDATGRHMTKP